MPQEYISIGRPTPILQNIAYALPSFKCTLYVTGTPTIVQSNTQDMAVTTAVTLVEGQYTVAGGFIKCTSGNITITLKRD